MINEKVSEAVEEEAPEFQINRYNIYRPSEVQEWMRENGLEGDPGEASSSYMEWARSYLRREVVPELERINDSWGPIGFISDNSLEAKEFFEEVFYGLEYSGFVLSEQVGVEKPDPGIFRRFLEVRNDGPFVYFGNHAKRDAGAERAGMCFVWCPRFHTFGTEYEGTSIDRVNVEQVSRAMQEVRGPCRSS